MRTVLPLCFVAAALVATATCTSKDYILQPNNGDGGNGGSGGSINGEGGAIGGGTGGRAGTGGSPSSGVGGDFAGAGGSIGGGGAFGAGGALGSGGASLGFGGSLGTGGSISSGFGGSLSTGTGGRSSGVGGAPGAGGSVSSGTGGAGGSNCLAVTTLPGCQDRSDCHAVFLDPNDCGCTVLGCCAQFNHCADGSQAACTGQVTCAVETPHCEGPYVLSYLGDCFEGCVESQDCAP